MSMIEKLIELRIDNFIREFDIILTDFDIHSQINMRKKSWEVLKQKLIKQKYATNEYHLLGCSFVIKNIIWKNIMSCEIINEMQHIYMFHSGVSYRQLVFRHGIPVLNYKILLGGFYNHEFKNNCDILQTKIINYLLLLDIIVTENMIYDLAHILKEYIFDVILIL